MTDYLTEQEQIELLKNWIKQYSLVILTGVLLAIVGISGWRYWQQRQTKNLTHASVIYDEMLTKHAQNNSEVTITQAQKLYDRYHKTVYGQLAAFMLAKEAIDKKDYQTAENQLKAVLHQSNLASFRQIARLRLARVLLVEQKPSDAIKILEKVDDKNFNGLINEIRGDGYLAMKNLEIARQSYKEALRELPDAETIRPLLQMKYDNLVMNP